MQTRIFARLAAALILASSMPVSGFAHHDNPAEHAAEEGGSNDHRSADYSVGDIIVDTPWSRATPPTANVAAGYLTIRNDGDAAERFASASSPSAQRVEIHAMEMVNDVMQMRHLRVGFETHDDRASRRMSSMAEAA